MHALAIILILFGAVILIVWVGWMARVFGRLPFGHRAFVLRMEPYGLHPHGLQSHDARKPAADYFGRGGSPGAATGFATHQPEGPSKQPLGGGF